MRKIAMTFALLLVTSAAAYLWADNVLASEPVRAAIGRQLSLVLGQPVQIGRIRARLIPRVTIALGDVRIGDPARITVRSLDIGTGLRALLSRRVELATITVAGGHVDLPLPDFAFQETSAEDSEGSIVKIVSVDRIHMVGLTVTSGGRTLHADAELLPSGHDVVIRRAELEADGTSLTLSGRLTDLSGPAGELTVKADRMDLLAILAFVGDFSKGAAATSPSDAKGSIASPTLARPATPTHLDIEFEAGRAQFAALGIVDLVGRAAVSDDSVTLSPVRFGVLGGRCEGRLTLTPTDVPTFSIQGTIADLDMTAVNRFAGSADTMTGRVSGRLDVASRGATAADVLAHARGTGRVDVRDGIVKGLGLVRSVVIAGSMRTGTSVTDVHASDSPFSHLGATLAIDDGLARTGDLQFESPDVLMTGAGTFALDGSRINLRTRIQLSDELSRQAGRDLVRYTASDGRVTAQATITGQLGDLRVFVDPVDLVKRAITNRAEDEAKKAIKRELDRVRQR